MTSILDNLTEGELKALRVLIAECLECMGGKRPADLENDPWTWCYADTLIEKGYSRHEAAGYFSSLSEKGVIEHYETRREKGKRVEEYVLNNDAWRAFDAIW